MMNVMGCAVATNSSAASIHHASFVRVEGTAEAVVVDRDFSGQGNPSFGDQAVATLDRWAWDPWQTIADWRDTLA